MKRIIPILLFLILFPAAAFAQTAACDALTAESADTAKKVMQTAYLYDCCDETIEKCLKKQAPCKLAQRLADEVCGQAAKGKSAKEIKHLLDQRSTVMMNLSKPSTIEILPEHVWGNAGSKVVLSVYLCGRCPYCSRFVPELISALEKANLKDKVAVNLRLFPIKSHENSTQAAIAVEAAAKLGKGWPFLLNLYAHFDSYSAELLQTNAMEAGLNVDEFNALMQDSAIRNKVVLSKKEGLTNDVESTPTFFLNGRKIQSAFDVDTMLSMIEEALDAR